MKESSHINQFKSVIQSFIGALSNREKYAIYIGIAGILVFIVLQGIVFPIANKQKLQHREIQTKTSQLAEMLSLKAEYDGIVDAQKISRQKHQNKPANFSLLTYIDKLAGESGLKETVKYMKPSVKVIKDSPFKMSMVEMKLQGISLKQLADFLYKTETSPYMITVNRLSISKSGTKEVLLTAVLMAQTIET